VGDGAMRVRIFFVMGSGGQWIQAAREVGLQVLDVLEAPPRRIMPADAGGLALVFGEAAVRGAGRVGDDVCVSPKLAAMLQIRVASMTAKASARPPFTSKDSTAPPWPFCWRIASACCGCEARPG
jgi:hypothetical protein